MSPTTATSTRPATRSACAAVLLAAMAVAAVDLTAKLVAEARLVDTSVDLGWLDLRLAHNTGVAFSLGHALPAAVVTLTAAIAAGIFVYVLRRAPHAGSVERIAGGAVIGGAIANLIDRTPDGCRHRLPAHRLVADLQPRGHLSGHRVPRDRSPARPPGSGTS